MANKPLPANSMAEIRRLLLEHKDFSDATREKIKRVIGMQTEIAEWESQNETENQNESQTESKNKIERTLAGLFSVHSEKL